MDNSFTYVSEEEDMEMDLYEDMEMDPYTDIDLDIEKNTLNMVEDPKNNMADLNDAFITTQVFLTRDDLLKWARNIAYEMDFVIVILRSDRRTGQVGRRTFVLLGCERGGRYRAYKKDVTPKATETRKCDCPFRLKGKPLPSEEGWTVQLLCGLHNHDLVESLAGHPYAGRLSSNEKSLLIDMTKSHVKPKNILLTLKDRDEKDVTTMKQVYNARCRYRSSVREDRTEMQQLMKLLERDMYIYWHRVHETSYVVRDLFWTHPDAVKLLNAFPIVLLIDSTYKTNKYRMPLMEIVGVTPTGLTFSVAFAYLESERADNVSWALERLKGLFLRNDGLPQVIVSDQNLALMNAINVTFPEAVNLLCRFHIDKNVKARCKMYVHPKSAWDHVMDAWGSVVDSPSEYDYENRVSKFEIVCAPWPMFVDYAKDTWLNPYHDRFVKAWVDKVMHIGNTTSNRTESAHWNLKRLLLTSVGDLCTSWEAINNMIILQLTEIRASFEKSIHVVGHTFNITLYKRLIGMVFRIALAHIAEEHDRCKYVGVDSSRCGCILRTTYGLPCACEISRYVFGSISTDTIHIYWRKLSFSDQGINELDISLTQEIDDLLKRFNVVDICGKISIKSKLREILYPDETSTCALPEKVKTKGARKKSEVSFERSTKRSPSFFEHVDAMHSVHDSSSSKRSSQTSSLATKPKKHIPMLDKFQHSMHPYIVDVVDVKADSNCGYRVIAALLNMGEDSWPLVRMSCLEELGQWRDDYTRLLGSIDRFEEMRRSLMVDDLNKATVNKWIDITKMGYVIASRYNVILVFLSIEQSMTFFPLRSTPPRDSAIHRIICIGHIYGNRFVQVFLQDRCPIPLTAPLWRSHCQPDALNWMTRYISRMQQYSQLSLTNMLRERYIC